MVYLMFFCLFAFIDELFPFVIFMFLVVVVVVVLKKFFFFFLTLPVKWFGGAEFLAFACL